jgi:putative ABC transport system substrate-binding protein
MWSGGNADDIRQNALELVALAPDVILADGSPSVAALLQATRAIPIVFALVVDPVGSGYVKSLSRPGGNVTGFMQFEYSLSGKWLGLLKELAPDVTRAAVLRDAASPGGIGQFAVIQAAAPTLGLDVSPVNVREASEIENGVAEFARSSNGGLIVTASASSVVHRKLIITLAAKHKLPAVYFQPQFATEGALSLMEAIRSSNTGAQLSMLIAYSKVTSLSIYRCRVFLRRIPPCLNVEGCEDIGV